MCGFAGFLGYSAGPLANWQSVLHKMGRAIRHRGPDDADVWFDPGSGIGLAHQRLSVVDLSAAGRQPMTSATGRYVLAFNGEIYNHLNLRTQLEAEGKSPAWRGHSDTESLLAAVEAWGLTSALKVCVGMFALALWDKSERKLLLARDRIGEKPLYYGLTKGFWLFGSELSALRAHPTFLGEVNRNALALMMRHNHVPAPYSIYEGIGKLLPGCVLTLSAESHGATPVPYWDAKQVLVNAWSTPFSGSAGDAVDTLDRLLRDAVDGQMVADVPVGAFLSGGIDSSTVVALMQDISRKRQGPPARTFTIGFHEDGYDEVQFARAIARHLGTDHTELYVSAQAAMDVIPLLPQIYSEPFADSSQIPTYLVSALARRQVTVSLSGDGGDELFAGYRRYLFCQHVWSRLSTLPVSVRTAASRLLVALSPSMWNRILWPMQAVLPGRLSHVNIGDKLHKGAEIMAVRSASELYYRLVSHWPNPQDLVANAIEPLTQLTNFEQQVRTGDNLHDMMALDLLSYLPDDILCKVDRAAMAVSLETRVPLLDHRVVEFAWSLSSRFKIHDGAGKWLLREVLYRYVPRHLVDRPKMGFGVPLDRWLRGPLRDWAEDLLSQDRLAGEGYLNATLVRSKWAEHLSGKRNWQSQLWPVLMFQAWLHAQKAT